MQLLHEALPVAPSLPILLLCHLDSLQMLVSLRTLSSPIFLLYTLSLPWLFKYILKSTQSTILASSPTSGLINPITYWSSTPGCPIGPSYQPFCQTKLIIFLAKHILPGAFSIWVMESSSTQKPSRVLSLPNPIPHIKFRWWSLPSISRICPLFFIPIVITVLSSYLTSRTVGNVIVLLITLLAHGKNLLHGCSTALSTWVFHCYFQLIMPQIELIIFLFTLAIPLLNVPIPLTAPLTPILPSPNSSPHDSLKAYAKEPMSFPPLGQNL